jgi:hypothetical protein
MKQSSYYMNSIVANPFLIAATVQAHVQTLAVNSGAAPQPWAARQP